MDRSSVDNFVTREHRRRYDKIALPCLVELLELLRETKSRLGEIRQPILIVQASKDRVVPLGNADYIFQNLSSERKRILWLANSGHVAAIDFDKHILFKEASDFFKSLSSGIT